MKLFYGVIKVVKSGFYFYCLVKPRHVHNIWPLSDATEYQFTSDKALQLPEVTNFEATPCYLCPFVVPSLPCIASCIFKTLGNIESSKSGVKKDAMNGNKWKEPHMCKQTVVLKQTNQVFLWASHNAVRSIKTNAKNTHVSILFTHKIPKS